MQTRFTIRASQNSEIKVLREKGAGAGWPGIRRLPLSGWSRGRSRRIGRPSCWRAHALQQRWTAHLQHTSLLLHPCTKGFMRLIMKGPKMNSVWLVSPVFRICVLALESVCPKSLACAVQQAGELRNDIAFWDTEPQSDAVCVHILGDTVCDPAAANPHHRSPTSFCPCISFLSQSSPLQACWQHP